ncbi:MAG: hypothetical protein SGILL_004812 [Bacillariaceae sp.]
MDYDESINAPAYVIVKVFDNTTPLGLDFVSIASKCKGTQCPYEKKNLEVFGKQNGGIWCLSEDKKDMSAFPGKAHKCSSGIKFDISNGDVKHSCNYCVE